MRQDQGTVNCPGTHQREPAPQGPFVSPTPAAERAGHVQQNRQVGRRQLLDRGTLEHRSASASGRLRPHAWDILGVEATPCLIVLRRRGSSSVLRWEPMWKPDSPTRSAPAWTAPNHR